MIEQIQEFVSEQTAAISGQVRKFRKESAETVRESMVGSADNIKSLKTPIRVFARSGVKLTAVSQTAVSSFIELQSDMLTSAISDVALRLERAARAENVIDFVRDQFELIPATRTRVVEDAQRAAEILKIARRDLRSRCDARVRARRRDDRGTDSRSEDREAPCQARRSQDQGPRAQGCCLSARRLESNTSKQVSP